VHSGPTEEAKYLVSQTFIILVHQGLVLGAFVLHLSASMPHTILQHLLNYIFFFCFNALLAGLFAFIYLFFLQEYPI
jgi:hypothetical protein